MSFIKRLWKLLGKISFAGLMRLISLTVQRKKLIVLGSCHGCGSCCRKINLQTTNGWIRKEEEFLKACEVKPEYSRFYLAGKDEQGFLLFSCSWVGNDGLCIDYENRLSVCKDYPDASLVLCGGELLPGCGYKIEAVTPFAHVLQMEIDKKRIRKTV